MIKKIAKYATNILAIINALIIGLSPIWSIPYAHKVSETIIVLIGIIGTYLLGSKAIAKKTYTIAPITHNIEEAITGTLEEE